MKKLILLLLLISISLTIASCEAKDKTTDTEPPPPGQTQEPTPVAPPEQNRPDDPGEPFEGKIVIITPSPSVDFNYRNAQPVVAKYGSEKIVHKSWSWGFLDSEVRDQFAEEIGEDNEVRAVVVNPFWVDSPSALEKILEKMEDMFIVYCLGMYWSNHEQLHDLAQTADMIIILDTDGMGPAMAQQAHKMGAETFVHYTMSWSMDLDEVARRDLIERECDALGIVFVEVVLPDYLRLVEAVHTSNFFREDVPRVVEEYGLDTALYSPDYPVEMIAYDLGAIIPQPYGLLFSPLNVWLRSISNRAVDTFLWEDEDFGEMDLRAKVAIESTREALAERGMLGRVSNWPIPYHFMNTYAATEYAIKWINGEVSRERIDVGVLKQLMEDYAGVEVFLNPYIDPDSVKMFENILLMRMDYITY